MDEAGIDNREEYPYGYCKIGERFQALKSGKRTHRVSWIAALKQGNLFAPMTFDGSCNRDLVEMWLKDCLLPKLNVGDVIVIALRVTRNAMTMPVFIALKRLMKSLLRLDVKSGICRLTHQISTK